MAATVLSGCGKTKAEKTGDADTVIPFLYKSVHAVGTAGTFFAAETGGKACLYLYSGGRCSRIVPPGQYDGFGVSCGDTVSVRRGGKQGLLNKSGQVAVSVGYDKIFLSGILEDGSTVYIANTPSGSTVYDADGRKLISVPDTIDRLGVKKTEDTYRFIVSANGAYGAVQANGTEILPVKYKSAAFAGNYIIAQSANGKFGLFDLNGRTVQPLVYTSLTDAYQSLNGDDQKKKSFVDGMGGALFYTKGVSGETMLIKPDGKQLLGGFSTAVPVGGGLFSVAMNGKSGITDRAGQVKLGVRYDLNSVETAGNGTTGGIVKLNGKTGVFDNHFNLVVPFGTYSKMNPPDENGIAVVEKDKNYGIVSSSGQALTPVEYDKIEDSADFPVAAVEKNGRYGFLYTTGKTLLEPIYDGVGRFSAGIARVDDGSMSAYVNLKGKLITSFVYDAGGSSTGGIGSTDAFAEPDGKVVVISSKNGLFGCDKLATS